MEYQDRISKVQLKKLLPKSVIIFISLILLLVFVAWLPTAFTIVLATMMVVILVIMQALVILKDKG